MYQQDDRDRRDERAAKNWTACIHLAIRLRLPGGAISADKWIAVNEIANEHSTGVIKITTKANHTVAWYHQIAYQTTIQSFNKAHLDSVATCGTSTAMLPVPSHPAQSPLHAEIFSYASKISPTAVS